MVSAAPVRVTGETVPDGVVGWRSVAVEERWWDARSRRVARFQLTLDDGRGTISAHLAEIRDRRWWLVADYA